MNRIKLGDILLLNGQGKTASCNRLAQSMITGENANYTHVALCIHDNLAIHAMPPKGVEPILIEELFKGYSDWMAIRNTYVSNRADNEFSEMLLRATKDLEKPYALKSVLSSKHFDGAAVCSNYIASFLLHYGVNVSATVNSAIPLDFHDALTNGDWENVTQQHRDYYTSFGYDTDMALCTLEMIKMNRVDANLISSAHNAVDKLCDVLQPVNQFSSPEALKTPKPKFGYWDTDNDK